MIIPGASPTGQMGGGSLHPSFPVVGRGLTKGLEVAIPVGLTVISLVGVGKFLKAARVLSAADAALVRLYQTGRIPWIGGATLGPPGWIGPAVTIAGGTISTWFTPSSSGGGGPGESPISTVVPPSIEEAGEILSNPPSVDWDPSQPAPQIPRSHPFHKRCPPGHTAVWSKRQGKFICKKVKLTFKFQKKG